jgi:hypothetical protein
MKQTYSSCGDMEKRVGKMCGGVMHKKKKKQKG